MVAYVIIGDINRKFDYIWIKIVFVIVRQGISIGIQVGSALGIIAKPMPFPPVGQAVVIRIFIHRVVIAQVGRVGVGKAAVLWGIGGHGAQFSQQVRVDIRGAHIAVRAVGGKVVVCTCGSLKNATIVVFDQNAAIRIHVEEIRPGHNNAVREIGGAVCLLQTSSVN